MLHLPPLITDLALILGAAAVITLLFKRLKQPVVLGYIVAGLLCGPNFNLFPTVVELESIRTWADIGVIFLLFGLGLEFSFKKLVAVGGVAVVTALMGVSLTMISGYGLGKLLGWEMMDSLFLGGILAIASTTIIIRAFEELDVRTQKFTGIVTGVLVIEDLVAVVLMVVLTTVSVSRSFQGAEMMGSVLKLIFFLILWFVSGIFFLPSLLKALRKLLNEETLMMVSLALCFLMVVAAAAAGFSAALGAFIMGSILAETTKAERIEHQLKPIKNLFGAIFFVSVGMLIDPKMLVEYWLPISLATIVLLFGKPLFVTLGALIVGQPLRIAIQSGMSLSQIGEFSFIIATLGLTLKVTADFLYPVAVAVSVLTTFTTPYMIKFSPFVYSKARSVLPASWLERLNRYSIGAQNVAEEGHWKRLLRFYGINVTIFSVIIIFIIFLSTRYMLPLFSSFQGGKTITAIVSLLILTPFLWALAFKRMQREAYAKVWASPLQRGPLIILMISRLLLALFFIGFLFHRLYTPGVAVAGVIITTIILFPFYHKIKSFYGKIEIRFLNNFNSREEEPEKIPSGLAPLDTHIAVLEMFPNSPYVGKTLQEARIREDFGVNVAVIERGNRAINIPAHNERLYPYDKLSVIGTDEQLRHFREFMDISKTEPALSAPRQTVTLLHFTIAADSGLLGSSIRHSGIRERANGLVVGIERNGGHILNPESDLVFQKNDIVWVVGNEKRIAILAKQRHTRTGVNSL